MKILKDLYDWVLSWSNSKWGKSLWFRKNLKELSAKAERDSLIYSTAGVKFCSRIPTDEIYKNASTRPSLFERYILRHGVQKKSQPKKMRLRVFEAIY